MVKSKILEKTREQFAERMKSIIPRPAELAEKIGVSTASVYNYRNGKVPEADVLLRIAEETGTDWRWLLTGETGNSVSVTNGDHESAERLSRADRRRLEKVEDIFRGSEDRTKQRLRAVIDLIE
jgi:transcriptional regulator with XRE-family HTH domain